MSCWVEIRKTFWHLKRATRKTQISCIAPDWRVSWERKGSVIYHHLFSFKRLFQLQMTASVRERPLKATWALLLCLATAVREPMLLFVTERSEIYRSGWQMAWQRSEEIATMLKMLMLNRICCGKKIIVLLSLMFVQRFKGLSYYL